jgi:DNA-binding CsgD family transcriptional regulator
MSENDPRKRLESLTERQLEVLKNFCEAKKYKDIGFDLSITEDTVKTHMGNIYESLGLNEYPTEKRRAMLFQIYCPLLKENFLKTVSGSDIINNLYAESSQILEEEIPDPIIRNNEKMSKVKEENNKDHDESAKFDPKKKSSKPRRYCLRLFLWSILIAVLTVVAFLYLGDRINTPNILDNWFSQQGSQGDSSTVPTDLPEEIAPSGNPTEIVETATSPPITNSPNPTSTLDPTNTPIPSPTPIADTAPDSILEVGDWWKEDGLWLRVSEIIIHESGGISIFVEVWNKTLSAINFQWNTTGNFTLKDNNGYSYPIDPGVYENRSHNEIIEPNEIKLLSNIYGAAVYYKDDMVFNPSVYELIVIIEDLSRIELAHFKFTVNK